MRLFECGCDQHATLFFDSVSCTVCGRMVGYCTDRLAIASFDLLEAPNLWLSVGPDPAQYRQCSNYHVHQVCNWMVRASDPDPFCSACRLNGVIPDLAPPLHREYWARLEAAKRRMLCTLLELGLPIKGKREDPQMGLQFLFLADKDSGSEFTQPLVGQDPIYTGHNEGDITINLAEADEVARTRARIALGENYRTLLGHFRHEAGHYFWFVLVSSNMERLAAFRELFGDDRADYKEALARYYELGAPKTWGSEFLTAYSTMHPWEDWAEVWAHYLHMIDTLETAESLDLRVHGGRIPSAPLPQWIGPGKYHNTDLGTLLTDWMRLAVGLNALNRSMGLQDAYPFVLTDAVQRKLDFIHRVVVEERVRTGALDIREHTAA